MQLFNLFLSGVIATTYAGTDRSSLYRVFSSFAQVNITNPTSWLVKFDVLSCYIHLHSTGEYNKTEIFKMVASRFVEVILIKK
jgi:hypothetical protein